MNGGMAFDGDHYGNRVLGTAAAALGEGGGAAALCRAAEGAAALAEATLDACGDPEERQHIACRAGCGSCCAVSVAVLFPEAVRIWRHLEDPSSARGSDYFAQPLDALYRQVRWLDEEERILLRQSCVFLDEGGGCAIYPVRPLLCRSITSVDPQTCHDALALQALGESPPVLMNVFQKTLMDRAFDALGQACREAGLDGGSLPLTVALWHLSNRPALVDEYLGGAPLRLT